MAVVIVLLVLARVVGGVGLLVAGLKWLLIIALVLLAISIITGSRARSRA